VNAAEAKKGEGLIDGTHLMHRLVTTESIVSDGAYMITEKSIKLSPACLLQREEYIVASIVILLYHLSCCVFVQARLEKEKKDREKQKKKDRIERQKAEGTYLTPEQREKKRRALAMLEALKNQGKRRYVFNHLAFQPIVILL